jgi:hypothetical protein
MKPNIEWDGYNKGEEFTLFDTEINLLEERQQGNFFLTFTGHFYRTSQPYVP